MAGGNINRKITITAEVAASLKGMDKVVSDFQQKLSSLKVDPTSTKAKGLTKLFGDYKAAVKDFQSYIQNGQVDPINAKDVIKSGESVIKVFKRIQDEIGDITKLDVNLAKRLFPDEFSKNGKDAAKAIKEFESALNKAGNKKNALYEAGQDYAKLIEKRRELSSVKTKDDFTQELNAQAEATKAAAEQLQNLIKLQAMALAADDSDVVAAKKKLSSAKGAQTKANKAMATSGLSVTTLKRQKKIADGDTFESYEAETARLKRLQSRQVNNNQLQEAKRTQEKINARTSKDNQARRYLELEYKQRKAAEAVAQRQSEYDAALANAQSVAAKRIESGDRTGLSDSDVGAIEAATQALQDQVKAQEELNQAIENAPTRKQKESAENAQDAKIAKAKENIQKIKEEFTNLSNDTDFNALFEKLQNLGINTEGIDKSREGLEQLRQQLASMDSATVERIRQRLTEMGYSAEEAEKEILGIKDSLRQVEQQTDELKQVSQEIDSLTSRISSFFSIGSAINLFKRAIGDAYQAVKELDAAMTETAVVTDFSVGNMWEKLPQYTDMANELGASVLGAYQTATRYYQQGLDTNSALAASVETMKMARIASMDYASATELLTAALRGFNMEVNETSAARVNDVYSELAKITAADTEQIGIAMSKVASLAHSANMEFETTAAFLTQIIETTQEAPETAGTSLKTVLARFSEVKKLYSEGQLLGSDEEGQEINVNKIQEALRSVGISMKDFLLGKEGLDQVLLRLAERWDTLDVSTQRYIATQAAGSRQQSRFLALLADYSRTQELVSAAYNSAGSANEQFEKTLDSLEAKLNKLSNAWNEFTMGIAQNGLIKASVDGLTGLLTIINKITGVFGPTTGAILKMGLAFVALRTGAKLLPNLFKAIATTIVTNGDKAGQGFGQRIVNALAEKTPEVYARGYTMGQAARQGFEDGAKGNAPVGAGASSIGSSVPLLSSGKENPTENLKASPDNFKKQYTASAVMTGVGMGINLLTNAVRENADELSAAQDEALSYFETLGNGLTIVGAGTAILTHFGVTLTEIGASLGVIGIAAAALYGAFKIASYFSYEKQLERATEAYQKAAQAYSDVISNKSAYQTQIEELNGLTRGTDEWNQKLLEVQETVASLRELGYEVSYQNGVPTIDFSSETNQRVIKEKEQASKQAQLEMAGDQLQSTLSNWLVLANTPVTTGLLLTEDQKQEKTQLENQGLNQFRQLMNSLPDEASDFAQQYEFFGKTIGDYTKADKDKLQALLESEDDFTNFITDLKEYSGIDSQTAGRLINIIKNALASGVKEAWNQVSLVDNTFAEFADAGLTQAQIQRANRKVASAKQISDDLENTVKTAYDDVVQNFSGEERDTLLLYLDNLDFSDPNLITNLESDFERLGVVAGSTTASALLALADAASAAGIAISKYNFAENKKQALSTRKIAKDIEENDTKEFDADTFAQIKAALNGTVEGDKLLAQMVEGQDGSYSFIGKRSELSTALYNSADESAAKGLEAVKFQAVAQKKLNYNQLDSIGVKNVADWSKYTDESEDNLEELFTKFIPETLSTQEKNALFGVSNFGKVDWNGTQGQELLSKLGEYLLDPEFYSRQVTEAQADFSPYGVDNTPQRILNASAGNQGSEEEANKYLQKQVQDSESGEAVLATWGETADKAANSILALATGTSDGIEKFEDFTKVVSDNKDALSAENKGLTKYSKALSETHKAAQKVFGDNLTEDFVEENLDLFKKMAEGDQDALLQIQHAIRDQALSEYATDEESQKQIDNIKAGLETLENSDVEIGAVLDGTQVFTALAAIMGGAEKAAAFLDSMGWTAVYTYGPDGTIATAQLVRTANAAAKSTTSGGGGGGGGGGGDKKDVWDNPYDILYNLTEKINEALRDREKLEKTYDRLLEDRNASFSNLIKNTLSTIANLEKEINLQTRLQQGRREQIEKIGRETYRNSDGIEKRYEDLGIMDYAHYDFDTQTITIDWEGLEQITDTEKGQAVEDYIGRLEELVEQYEETQDTLSDMEDELREIKERGKSEYLDFEQKVYDAIVARQQLLIDDFSDLASTISDTNSKILDDLSRSIELQRQIRDNTKTEQDLQDKEARLAYLQRDTSGANQTEILQLQKELEEARQNYQDTLIDQELDRLNEVNDVANDQRERQIEIMQAQLDWAAKNGEFWEETYTLIQGAFNEDGTFNNNSALVELLKGTDAFKGMSEFGQMNWIAELIKEYNQAQLGFSDWMVDRESKEGNTLQTNAGELTYTNGKWQDANGGIYALSYDPKTKSWVAEKADTSEGRPEIKDKVVSNDSSSSGGSGGGSGGESGYSYNTYSPSPNGPIVSGSAKASSQSEAKRLERQSYDDAARISNKLYGWNPNKGKRGPNNSSPSTPSRGGSGGASSGYGGSRWIDDKAYLKFASGGLTSKTGLAWLDGTLSRPEYVLNPIQTEAFLKLTKVLPSLLSGDVSTKTMMGGDNYYDVNFVVDSIGSDYDVDKLWNRFKEKIYEDSAYRNVHTINRLR